MKVKTYRGANPKAKPMTLEQESMMDRVEELNADARILECGVSKLLNCSEFTSPVELEAAERALRRARELRKEGDSIRRKAFGPLKGDRP